MAAHESLETLQRTLIAIDIQLADPPKPMPRPLRESLERSYYTTLTEIDYRVHGAVWANDGHTELMRRYYE